jgi:hypothetical protein
MSKFTVRSGKNSMEDFMKFFKYFLEPLMEEEGATGGAATAASTASTETGTEGATSGSATQIPDGNKPDAAWAEMRRKAKLADDLLKENEGYKAKFEKLDKKALPSGFKTVDEYLDYLDTLNDEPATQQEQTQQTQTQPAIDVNKIIDAVMGKINEHPVLKQAQKTQQDTFLVKSFAEAQKAFSDIQKPEDIPVEVWEAWDEGKSGRTLLSHLKEYRYDADIEAARKAGANQQKAQTMSTAHTAQVNGANAATEYDNVVVPEETKRQLEKIGIKDPNKQKYYYARHHRTE